MNNPFLFGSIPTAQISKQQGQELRAISPTKAQFEHMTEDYRFEDTIFETPYQGLLLIEADTYCYETELHTITYHLAIINSIDWNILEVIGYEPEEPNTSGPYNENDRDYISIPKITN